MSCSWLSPPHFPLKYPPPSKVSFLVWQYAHTHTSNLGPSHERKQVSLIRFVLLKIVTFSPSFSYKCHDFIFFTFKVLRKLTTKTVRKCSALYLQDKPLHPVLIKHICFKERHKTEEPFKNHQHYWIFQQSLERGNILNSSKFLPQFRTLQIWYYTKKVNNNMGKGLLVL